MSENSPVPDWFGRAEHSEAGGTAARASGCALWVQVIVFAIAALAVAAALQQHDRAKLLANKLEQAERREAETRSELERERQNALLPTTAAPPVATTVAPEPTAAPSPAVPEPANPDPATGSAGELNKVMQRSRAAFRRCYDVALAKNPGAQGKLVLRISIAPSGEVTSAQTNVTGSLPASVAACASQVARSLKFPEASGPAVVTYPMNFESQ